MLKQFRNRYPQGSVISELVTIDQKKYVVRVLVQVEGVILATALAAHEVIEEAEDKARQRALSLLDIDSTPEETPVKINLLRETPSPTIILEETKQKTNEANSNLIEFRPTKSDQPVFNVETTTIIEPQNNQPPEKVIADVVSPPVVKDVLLPPSPSPETTSATTSAAIPDYSDMMAQTDVEIKRLGWTKEEGKDYLLKTYGKKSRQLLSDEELKEFLIYLQTC